MAIQSLVSVAKDGSNLGSASLVGVAIGFYSSAQDPDNYIGVSVVQNQADEDCPYVVGVIERVGGKGNAKLVTHYPASQSWLDKQTALV